MLRCCPRGQRKNPRVKKFGNSELLRHLDEDEQNLSKKRLVVEAGHENGEKIYLVTKPDQSKTETTKQFFQKHGAGNLRNWHGRSSSNPLIFELVD